MPGHGPAERPGRPLGPAPDRPARRLVDQVGPREHDHPGPPERPDRLAEQAPREDPAQAERVEGVEQDDVEVAGEPAVLEPVVEDQHLALQLLDRDPGQVDPVGPWRWGTSGRFSSRTRPSSFSPDELAVAPAQDRDPDALGPIPAGDPLDHRRLARPAERQVADRDDRHVGPMARPSSPGRRPGSAPRRPADRGPDAPPARPRPTPGAGLGTRPGPGGGRRPRRSGSRGAILGSNRWARRGRAGAAEPARSTSSIADEQRLAERRRLAAEVDDARCPRGSRRGHRRSPTRRGRRGSSSVEFVDAVDRRA